LLDQFDRYGDKTDCRPPSDGAGEASSAGSQTNETGRVDNVYNQPGLMNLYRNATCCRLIGGSDDTLFIVCSGNYRRCDYGLFFVSDPPWLAAEAPARASFSSTRALTIALTRAGGRG